MDPIPPPPPRPDWLVQALQKSFCYSCSSKYVSGRVDCYMSTIYGCPSRLIKKGWIPPNVHVPPIRGRFDVCNVRWWCEVCAPPTARFPWDHNQFYAQDFDSADTIFAIDWWDPGPRGPTPEAQLALGRRNTWFVTQHDPALRVYPVNEAWPGFY